MSDYKFVTVWRFNAPLALIWDEIKHSESWMIYLAPVARPVFRWNHNVIMNWGGKGLAAKLDCKLL